jgi:hypothetical protein
VCLFFPFYARLCTFFPYHFYPFCPSLWFMLRNSVQVSISALFEHETGIEEFPSVLGFAVDGSDFLGVAALDERLRFP